jgi:hypothetical protein
MISVIRFNGKLFASLSRALFHFDPDRVRLEVHRVAMAPFSPFSFSIIVH